MNSLKRNQQIYGWLLIGPFLLTLVIFFLYALIRTLYFSFTEYDLFNEAVLVGLANFKNLLSDNLFLTALSNTIWFSLFVTIVQTVLALSLAILVNNKVHGQSFFKVAFYLPCVLSSAAVTIIFIWIYQKKGFLNGLISDIFSYAPYIVTFLLCAIIIQLMLVMRDRRRGLPAGICEPAWAFLACLIAAMVTLTLAGFGLISETKQIIEINWLNTHEKIGPMPLTLWAIVIQNIYTTIPTFMLLFLAGLQGIPDELYEAAYIDGANRFQQHWYITIPQIAPVTFVVITFSIIGTLQMFDQVALMGTSAPIAPLESRITMAYYVYHNTFPPGETPQIGMASAAATVLALLTLVVVYLQKTFGVKEKVNA